MTLLDGTFFRAAGTLPAAVTEALRVTFLGWIMAGMSPVLVLTRGQRLIRVLTAFIGLDMAPFELNLRFDLAPTVSGPFKGGLSEVRVPVFGGFFR